MPGIDASIPLGIKQPDQMQSLSSLLNVANAGQQLQQNQQKTQQGAIDLQQRQGMINYIQSGDALNPDGSLDTTKLLQNASRYGDTGLALAQKFSEAHQQGTQANRFLNSLTTETRQQINQTLYSMLDAPTDAVLQGLDAIGKQYKGGTAITDGVKGNYQSLLNQQGPDAARAYLKHVAESTLPQTDQQTLNTPAGPTLSNNQESVIQNTKPNVPGVPQFSPVPGTRVVKLLDRSQQQTPGTDALGNPTVVNKDAFGNVTGVTPMPGTSTSPSSGEPYRFPPGENADTLKAAQSQRLAANRTAATVPSQVFNNNQIIKLAPEAGGSQWMDNVRHVLGGSGVALTNTTDKAQIQQQLGHYLALQTSQLAQGAGVSPTDAGQAVAAAQAGDTTWGPKAQQNTARVNRALASGSQLFNQGVENAFQNSGSDPFSTKRFQNQWSSAVSLDALRLYDAVKNKADDPEGLQSLVQDWGGVNSPKYKQALKDFDRMGSLVKQAK